MSNVKTFLSFHLLKHQVEHRGQVVVSNLVETKIPKFLRLNAQSFVFQAVITSPDVAEPYVVAVV